MEKWTYALLLIGSIAIPMLRSFEPRIRFYARWPALFAGIFVMMLVYIPWDIIFTQKGVWAFNHQYVLGLYIAGLPIEEWLFFVVITYCVVFTYEVIVLFFPRISFPAAARMISLLLGTSFLLLAIFHTHQMYTMVVMLVAGTLALLQPIIKSHKTWLSHFYVTYLITLVPFFIVNGILTSFPVVTYNDMENFGIRLYSIPIEDAVYLLGMMYITMMVYHKIRKHRL
jgi:lycopene cyclase domain-containing protein